MIGTRSGESARRDGRRGWTVLFVLFVILFLLILGFSLISWWRTEARQSHDYVDAQVAQYLCEAAIDHALYVLKNHANDVNEPPLTDLPKKFATEDKFAFNVIPHWAIPPKDAMFPGMNVSIVDEARRLVPTGRILSCDVEYEKTEEFAGEQKLRSGILRLVAIAESNGVRRKVVEEHRCHVYKNIPIKWDHVLYINNKEDEIIPGRRDRGYSGWKKFLNALAMNTKFHQQELYVNGKAFVRKLVVPINAEKDSGFMGSFETDESMIQKLGKKAVDTNHPPSQLQIGGFSDFLDLNLTYREIDSKGFSAWMNGGTRGNTDLTGFDPAGKLRKFFTTLGFSDKTDRKPNVLVGDIRRVYEKKSGTLAGDWSPVVEDYITRSYTPNTDPVPVQDGTGYDTANGYYFGKDSKTLGDANLYPEDRIDGLFPEEVYRKIATRIRRDTTKVRYKIGKDEVDQDVVRYYGFGPWQAAPSSTGFFGAIKDFFRAKTGREAAIANPEKYAIKLKGFEFVDGDAHVEGVYRGVGTIVATGNIYIGNEIIRCPTDTSGQSVSPTARATTRLTTTAPTTASRLSLSARAPGRAARRRGRSSSATPNARTSSNPASSATSSRARRTCASRLSATRRTASRRSSRTPPGSASAARTPSTRSSRGTTSARNSASAPGTARSSRTRRASGPTRW